MQEQPIVYTVVPDVERLDALPKHFGKAFLDYERHVYHFMDKLCPDYQGGFWEFCELSNGGFFMLLEEEELITLNSPNGSTGELSVLAASVTVGLFALNALSFRFDEDKLVAQYHQLLDYAGCLEEASTIFELID